MEPNFEIKRLQYGICALHNFLFHVLGFCSRKKKCKVSNESLSELHMGQHLPKDVVPKLKFLVNEYIIDRNCLTQPYLVRFLKFLSC